jgi:hypothetical protein
MSAELGNWRNISRLLGIRVQSEVLRHLPDEDLAIVRGRRNERVVEGAPVGVEDGGRVTAEEGDVSGARPRSSRGMTAKAPPPLASQLTEMYCGLACRG